mmetsp:Transcript_5659/g.10358  ORF Transcript_5659/g.10358 Transcript_5659/m.10358 type:complete len:261 (-) Transcript_5659:1926-2708(-)
MAEFTRSAWAMRYSVWPPGASSLAFMSDRCALCLLTSSGSTAASGGVLSGKRASAKLTAAGFSASGSGSVAGAGVGSRVCCCCSVASPVLLAVSPSALETGVWGAVSSPGSVLSATFAGSPDSDGGAGGAAASSLDLTSAAGSCPASSSCWYQSSHSGKYVKPVNRLSIDLHLKRDVGMSRYKMQAPHACLRSYHAVTDLGASSWKAETIRCSSVGRSTCSRSTRSSKSTTSGSSSGMMSVGCRGGRGGSTSPLISFRLV